MKAVLIPARVKDGAVKLSLILPLREEVEGHVRRNGLVVTLFLIKQNFSICNCTGRSNSTDRHCSLTSTFVNVIHMKLAFSIRAITLMLIRNRDIYDIPEVSVFEEDKT